MTNVSLPYSVLIAFFFVGGILSVLYLGLLWYSVKLLPKIKRRGLFLFFSAAIRLFLFLFLAVYLAQNHVGQFLWIVIGFITTRLVLLSFIKNKRRSK